MSGYIGTQPVPQSVQHREAFTATSGQTSFATAGYTPQFLDVYLNGIHLVNGDDYTATNGSDVVLTTGAATDDILEVVSYTPFEVADQTFTGTTTVVDSNAAPLVANRQSSDGSIVDFKKDGTTVGSIGVDYGTEFYIGGGGSGLYLNTSTIRPTTGGAASTLTDGTIDFGYPTARWKDLYLSGGVYLGGTGAANLLDDYEEGTFTPYWNAGTSLVYTTQVGKYTKVGNVVTYHIHVRISSGSVAGNLINGLPFTVANVGDLYQMTGGVWNDAGVSYPSGRTSTGAYTNPNSTLLTVECWGSGVSPALPVFGSASGIYVTGAYYTTA